MSKIFTWLFGATTGLFAGLILIAWSMVEDPTEFIHMAKTFIDE